MEKLPKVPCILHMDSIKGSHRGLKKLFRSYLWEEWKERQNQLQEDVSSKFLNLRFVTLELPQQENSCDCGLFLLHYVELFLACAPVDFSPFKITKFSDFLTKDWFPPSEASLKRAHIKKLIYEIVEETSEKAHPAPCKDDKHPPTELPGIEERDTDVEILLDKWNSPETCHSNYSIADQEIEIIPSVATLVPGVQCTNEHNSVFRELLEPRAAGGLLLNGSRQPFGKMVSLDRSKKVMSPIEEGEEAWEQFSNSTTEKVGGQQLAEVTEIWTPLYSAEELRALEQCPLPVVSIDLVEYEDGDSLSGSSVPESPISPEVRVIEDHRREEFLGSSREREKPESSSVSSGGISACVIEDSEEEDGIFDVDEAEKSSFRLGKILGSSNQEANSIENIVGGAIDTSPASDSSEQVAPKRPRLMC